MNRKESQRYADVTFHFSLYFFKYGGLKIKIYNILPLRSLVKETIGFFVSQNFACGSPFGYHFARVFGEICVLR